MPKMIELIPWWMAAAGFGLSFLFSFLWIIERQKRFLVLKELYVTEKAIEATRENKEHLKSMFQSLSLEVLDKNNRIFLDLAQNNLKNVQESIAHDMSLKEKSFESLVNPIRDSLGQMDTTLKGLEKERLGAYEGLKTQVDHLLKSQHQLRHETATLSKALRAPHIRGRWGEIQLRRLVELSGLSSHCDFTEQNTLTSSEGRFRPDMIVHLPQKKCLVLDAKAPLSYYLEAIDVTEDKTRGDLLQKHAQSLRHHVTQLSSKAYWQQFDHQSVPEFVVLFLPGDPFFSAALEADPGLIEWSLDKKVILTTPSTLMALLHAVAYGWRQENLSQQIIELSQVGRELAKRFKDVVHHMGKVGNDVEGVVKSYNRLVGSFEARLMPGARRFQELSGQKDPLPALQTIDALTRTPYGALQEEEAAL
jgi:DNA recombination protein RmuC